MSGQTFSTFTEVGMIDARLQAGAITLPTTTSIPYRILTLKDVYGATTQSTVTIQTQAGDTFEDGTTSRALNASWASMSLYAGVPGIWYTIGGSVLTSASISSLTVSSIYGLQGFVSTPYLETQLGSTVVGLGTAGYISSSQLLSTSLGLTEYISSFIDPTELTSTVVGLGTQGFVSSLGLTYAVASTAQGLGTFGYTSTSQLLSTSLGLYQAILNSPTALVQANLTSTIIGLGTFGYLSTVALGSVVSTANLANHVSTANLATLVSTTYLATQLGSTVRGLGTAGYLSSINYSTVGLSSLTAQNINSVQGYISSLVVDSLQLGSNTAYIYMGDVIATSLSTVYVAAGSATILSISAQQLFVSSIQATNIIGALTTTNLTSTVVGLGTAGYISSSQLLSTSLGLSQYISSFIDPTELTSTVVGLGTQGFVSSLGLTYAVASTAQGLGTFGYTSTSQLLSTSLGLYQAIQNSPTALVQANLTSTVIGLGTAGYISSAQLLSTTYGYSQNFITQNQSVSSLRFSTTTGNNAYISSLTIDQLIFGDGNGWADFAVLRAVAVSTLQINTGIIYATTVSTTQIIGVNFLSQANLTSTVIGLGTVGYLSSQTAVNLVNLVSTANLADLVSTTYLATQLGSTVIGLGTAGYISSSQLLSTSLGLSQYISSFIDPTELTSTVVGLGTQGFVSSLGLTYAVASTAQGLGTFGYTSTSQLLSTSLGLYQAILNSPTALVQANLTSTIIGLGTFGYLSTVALGSLISTANLANLVSTANLANLVSTANLANLVSTANLANHVSTANLGNLVSTANLANHVSTANLVNLVSTANLANHVSTANLASLVSTTYLATQLGSTVIGLGSAGYLSTGFSTLISQAFFTSSLSTTNINTANINSLTATISSLTVNALFIGTGTGFTDIGDTIGTSMSTITITANTITAITLSTQQLNVSSITGISIVSQTNLTSTVIGLGTAGYLSSVINGLISTANLTNLVSTANLANLVSTANLTNFVSTANLTNLVSTANLANLVSTIYIATQLGSTVIGLGTAGYISSSQLLSTSLGLTQYMSSFIDPTELTSTVIGLGTAGFVSSLGLTYAVASTAQGLGTFGYTSTSQLLSTSLGLYQEIQNSPVNIKQSNVTSTIIGLGTFGYLSTVALGSLISTANLANLVSTANLVNLVSTANLANLVSTANLANFVSTTYLSTQLGSTFATLTVSSLSTFSLQGTNAFISSLTVNGLFAETDLRFRINNTDVIIMSNNGLYMSQQINMCNNNINNIYQLNFSNTANIDGAYANQLNFNATNSYFLGNLRFFSTGRTLDIADNIIQGVSYIYGTSGGFLTINAVNAMVIENNQGARQALNTDGSFEFRTTGANKTVYINADAITFNGSSNNRITNVSTINGVAYPAPSGAGVWASTATTALNMAGFGINNVNGIVMNGGILTMDDNPLRLRNDQYHALAFGNSGTYNVGINGVFLVGYRGGALGSSDPTFNDKSFAWSSSNLVAYKPLDMNSNDINNVSSINANATLAINATTLNINTSTTRLFGTLDMNNKSINQASNIYFSEGGRIEGYSGGTSQGIIQIVGPVAGEGGNSNDGIINIIGAGGNTSVSIDSTNINIGVPSYGNIYLNGPIQANSNLNMNNNDINNVSTIKAPSGTPLTIQNDSGGAFIQLSNTGNIYMVANSGATNQGMNAGLIFNNGVNITNKVFGNTSEHTFEVYDGSSVLQKTVKINSNGLDMCNTAINNAGIISSLNVYAGTAVIGTPSAYGNTYAYFGNNSLAANGGEYALLQQNNGTTFLNCKLNETIRFRNGNYDIMTLDSVALNMLSNNITNVNTISALSTQQITITQTSGSDFVLFNNGDTRQNAKRDAYVGGDRDVYVTSVQNMNIRAPDTQYITIQQTGAGNQSYLQFVSGGNAVLNSRTYIELVSQQGSNGIYLTGSFTECRGYLTFNTSNNYINNVRNIYGDTGASGGGLAIDYMYGLFFNSSGKNANLYIDAGNLNMINYNSGINIASYNSNGTGNFSLYSASNDMYLTSGTGRDINLNGGRTVSINAAQPGGSFGIYASTINAASLLDTNITSGRNMTLRADQPDKSITCIASTINLNGTVGVAMNLGGAVIGIAGDSNIYFTGNGSSRYANFQDTNVSFNTGTPGSLLMNMNGNDIINVRTLTASNSSSPVIFSNATSAANSVVKCEMTGANFIIRQSANASAIAVIENTGGGGLLINPLGTGNIGIGSSNISYKLDVAGIARSGIPVSSLTGTSATFGTNAFGIYYYITNSAFSNIGLYNTSGGATGTGGTEPLIGTGWYVTLRNNTGSYLSITVNGLLVSTPASPFTIPPSNSVTIAYDANLAGGAGYVFF